ncbi:MAG: iron ABC transporter substrate-binding protein [Candidatus Limnocylindria bacterium]
MEEQSLPSRVRLLLVPPAVVAVLLAACAPAEPDAESSPAAEPQTEGSVVIYSGRSEELVGPLVEQFEDSTGIIAEIRYGDSAEMAAQILTEGENSPADIFFSQDAGALGALAQEGMLAALPSETLDRVEDRFRSPGGEWVGVSGRARVVAYNTETVTESDLPDSILEFTDPQWQGRIGWAPTNGSFQAFVTAMRITQGEDVARDWLEGIQANDPNVYEGNTPALEAVASGEVDVAFINHYYLFQAVAEDPDYPAANHFLTGGDPGALVNVAGAAILNTAENDQAARAFVDYLLSAEAQHYFADETYEYPLVEGVEPNEALPALSEIETPEIDLSDLADLEGTLDLLREAGVL